MNEPKEESVAEFYAPVMAGRSKEVQHLVVRLLSREFKQASDLEDAIRRVAKDEASDASPAGEAS